jgi:hypothetical protein
MIFGSDCERGDFWSGLTAGVMSDGVACGEAAATRCTPCRTYFGGSLKRSPPSERGRSYFPPANRRKAHAGFPCRRRHRKPVMPLASWRFAPLCTPKAACATSCLWRSFLTRGTSGADNLAPAPRRCRANLRGLRLSRPLLSPPEEDAVAIRFPSPEGSGGLGNELLSVCSCFACAVRCIILKKESLPHTEARCM